MSAEVVSVVKQDTDRVEITVRRGQDLSHYVLTKVETPILNVIDYDPHFHADFRDNPDARTAMFDLARGALRDEALPLPLHLPDQ